MGLKDSYDILNKIGEGAFSSVFLALHRPTSVHVAIKIIKKNDHQNNKHFDVTREAEILKSLNHPNIVKLFEFFEDDTNYYFVQELCENGTVAQYINEHVSSESIEIKTIFLQLINAISYLHEVANILHCDIKAENILLDSNNNVKLADFGLSYDQKNKDEKNLEFSQKIKGSPSYIAPEILQGSNNSIQSDIWSSGIFLYYLLTGSLPFEDDEIEGLVHSIVKMKPAFPSYLSSEATNLLMKLLKKNPSKRYTIKQIKESKWLKNVSNSLDEAYKSINFENKDIDLGVVQQMMKINSEFFVSCEAIANDLICKKNNEKTISYNIMFKKKENDILHQQLKCLKKNSIPQRSSDLGSTASFRYRARSRSLGNRKEEIKSGIRQRKVLIDSKGNISRCLTPIKNLK